MHAEYAKTEEVLSLNTVLTCADNASEKMQITLDSKRFITLFFQNSSFFFDLTVLPKFPIQSNDIIHLLPLHIQFSISTTVPLNNEFFADRVM